MEADASSQKSWESFRTLLARLYLMEQRQIPEIASFMLEQHDFLAKCVSFDLKSFSVSLNL
jgi:hypothetical protein